jgi:hypothetical protein
MTFDTILESVMHTDQHIRYATIADMQGNEIRTRVREGVEPFLNPQDTKETLQYAANAWKIRKSFEPKIGKGQYVLAVYEKLRRLTMPIADKYLLMVTWGQDGGTLDIIEHLQNMFSGDPTKDW